MNNSDFKTINGNAILNDNLNVIERWEELGFLCGIEEGDKKYLADLYDALADVFVNDLTLLDFQQIRENINFQSIKGVLDKEINNIVDFMEVASFGILRRVYEKNKTISINEFLELMNKVEVTYEFVDEQLSLKNENQEYDVMAHYVAEMANEINYLIEN